MISVNRVTKEFDDITAVNNVSVSVDEGSVFGLLGTNGAGKSTLLRMIAGVIRPDLGEIRIDDMKVYDNPKAKSRIFFVSDTPYFFDNATPVDMQIFLSAQADKFLLQAGFYRYFLYF